MTSLVAVVVVSTVKLCDVSGDGYIARATWFFHWNFHLEAFQLAMREIHARKQKEKCEVAQFRVLTIPYCSALNSTQPMYRTLEVLTWRLSRIIESRHDSAVPLASHTVMVHGGDCVTTALHSQRDTKINHILRIFEIVLFLRYVFISIFHVIR
jgi:hypothetical protein